MLNKIVIWKNRLISTLISTLVCTLLLTSCTGQTSSGTQAASSSQTSSNSTITSTSTKTKVSVEYDSADENSSWNSSEATNITLNGSSIVVSGTGAVASGNKITISSAGTYIIKGTLSDGQVIVNTEDEEAVRLVLNGANITSSTSAPIYVKNAKKTVVVLADNTQNFVSDGSTYTLDDSESDEPNSAIFSKSDLTINGNGSLTVKANYKNAITSKDELKIMSGNITVHSVSDGIKGRDFVAVKSGTLNITADGDGIQSNNDEDTAKGFVIISDGTINITSGKDAIQAETSVLVSGGKISVSSGGGSANGTQKSSDQPGGNNRGTPGSDSSDSSTSDNTSSKGIKAAVDITIDGGNISIDSADDSIHSNGSLSINDGNITATSGDDGIHSDSTIDINGGEINITKSYEGIESAVVTINSGNIHVVSSDDGINIAGGNDSSSTNGRQGQNEFSAQSGCYLNINGGYIFIDASGDGLDSNGSINMSNGTVLVNGPTSDNNGALDYNGSFKMTGGLIAAAGSSGMAQAPDTTSTQYSVIANFTSTLSAGTMVHIETEDGEDVLSFVPTKDYQSIVLCSPNLKKGSTYNIYYGGSSTGTAKDGLYTGGTYSGGTKFDSFTISDSVTSVGTVNNREMGAPGGMMDQKNNGKQ